MSDMALATRPTGQLISSYDEAERAAKAMAASGFFADSRNAAQAVVKILAGQEMGFGPFASMNGVYIISGHPSIGANLMAAAVKKSGRYNYHIIEMTEKACSITFLENGKEVGVSTFTAEDARKAGTKNMDKYARNMLFARAMSNGVRWYCPDVFNGSTVYTPEELGATVNEDGEVIDMPAAPATSQPTNGKAHEPVDVLKFDPIAYLAEKTGLVSARITATLKYCELGTNATQEHYDIWWKAYKSARDDKLTPAEAGHYATLAVTNPSAAESYLTAITEPDEGEDTAVEEANAASALDGLPLDN